MTDTLPLIWMGNITNGDQIPQSLFNTNREDYAKIDPWTNHRSDQVPRKGKNPLRRVTLAKNPLSKSRERSNP
jgi:hypothetical protein